MSEEQFRILSEKLDSLIKLTAIRVLEGKNLTEQVEVLSAIGLQPKEIAEMTGADSNTISVLKSRVKSRKSVNSERNPQQGGGGI